MNWYLEVLRKYAEFNGRSRRKEYWMFFLMNMVIAAILGFIDGFIGTIDMDTGYGLLSGIYSLVVLVPGIAVSVRRLHDTGKSGWMLFISLIPLIGVIWLFILMIKDSDPNENQYGPNPKSDRSGLDSSVIDL